MVWNNRGGGLKTFPKINNKGVRVKKMTQKLFWYQYNKGRTNCCHILKAHKFSLMIYNYMDISSSLILIFFRFLCVFLMNFVQFSSCGKLSRCLIFIKNFFFVLSRNLAFLFYLIVSVIPTRETKFPVTALHSCVSFSVANLTGMSTVRA